MLALSLSMTVVVSSTVMAASKIDLRQAQNALEQVNQNTTATADRSPEGLAAHVGAAFGLQGNEQLSLTRSNTGEANLEHFHFDQTYKGVPIWGEKVVVSRTANGEIVRLGGTLTKGVSDDVGDVTPTFDAATALAKAEEAVKARQGAVADKTRFSDPQTRLVIYVRPADQKGILAYEVTFIAILDPSTGEIIRPVFLIDAKTGTTLFQYDNFQTGQGTGPGGNMKTGQYSFGPGQKYPGFDVLANSSNQCQMDSANVQTVNMNEGTTDPGTPFSYTCFNNTTKQINGGFAPMNDAQYFGSVVFVMYHDWYGMRPISQKLKMRVHYGNKFENAGWDGSQMNYGDGNTRFYPLVSLDVTGHEVSHGFTEQHSGLIYQHQSGGMNEAFSDMAGMATVAFATNAPTSTDYRIGESIFKANNQALRYMCNPTQDGASIDSAKNYTDAMDVHYTSGVFNKAFCLLSKKSGWSIRKAFEVFLIANRDYWTPSATFVSAATGVADAARDKGYSVDDVVSAFVAVDVIIQQPQSRYIYDSLRVITKAGSRGCGSGEWNCMTNLCKGDLGASAWRGWAGCRNKSDGDYICLFECSTVKDTTGGSVSFEASSLTK